MRSKLKAVFVLGIAVTLVPQLGLYRNWKATVVSIGGACIALLAYLAIRDLNVSRGRADIETSHSDSTPKMRDMTPLGSVQKDDIPKA